MVLIQLVKVQPRVFTAKCSGAQVFSLISLANSHASMSNPKPPYFQAGATGQPLDDIFSSSTGCLYMVIIMASYVLAFSQKMNHRWKRKEYYFNQQLQISSNKIIIVIVFN